MYCRGIGDFATLGLTLRMASVGYPLIAKNLQNLPDLLEDLPSQAPALLAFPQAFVKAKCSLEHVNMWVNCPFDERLAQARGRDRSLDTFDAPR